MWTAVLMCCGSVCFPKDAFTRTFRLHTLILTVCLFVVILPMIFYNDPFSVYHRFMTGKKSAEAKVAAQNDKRIVHASTIISGLETNYLNKGGGEEEMDSNKPLVTITVVTVSRVISGYAPKYLSQVTAKFLELIGKHNYDFRVNFSLCNMEPRPGRHPEADSLAKYVRVIRKPAVAGEWTWHNEERLKEGYVWCLNQTLDQPTYFAFLVEDDALPHDDVLEVVSRMIQNHMVVRSSDQLCPGNGVSRKHLDKTVFIKFYHPERLIDFIALDRERLPELLAFATVFSTILFAFYYLLNPSYRLAILENTSTVMAVFFLISTCACLCIGRHNMNQYHRLASPHLYYLTPSPSCCTQAVLYPRHSVPRVVSFLHNFTCNKTFSIDHGLDIYFTAPNRYAYLVQPNVFDHIGMYSAHWNEKIYKTISL